MSELDRIGGYHKKCGGLNGMTHCMYLAYVAWADYELEDSALVNLIDNQ